MATITEKEGDIFQAPAGSVLVHACNARGVWAKGVAESFKRHFPSAYAAYRAYCNPEGLPPRKLKEHQKSLLGNCFLATALAEKNASTAKRIACLITSESYGKQRSDEDTILRSTEQAIRHLRAQLNADEALSTAPVFAVRLNSGLFGVPWEDTRRVLEAGEVDMTVLVPRSTSSSA